LRACGASWVEFFKELDAIDFKMRHEKMIVQVQPAPTKRKIERDAMRYEIGIEMLSKRDDPNRSSPRIVGQPFRVASLFFSKAKALPYFWGSFFAISA